MKLKCLILMVAIMTPGSLSAKGLDELSPEVDKKEDDAPAPEAKPEGEGEVPAASPAPPAGEVPAEGETKPPADCLKKAETVGKDGEKAEGDEKTEGEKAPEECPAPEEKPAPPPPPERSALSQRLDNKLYLGTGMGFMNIGGRSGTWSSAANGDMEIGYLVKPAMMANTDLWATFRYDAIDVVVEDNRQSYRGVVQGYHFGAKGVRPWKERMKIVAAVEFGFLTTDLDSTDIFDKDEGLDKKGVNLTLSGGCDWTFWEKVTVGPRVAFGLGSLRTMRLAGTATFGF